MMTEEVKQIVYTYNDFKPYIELVEKLTIASKEDNKKIKELNETIERMEMEDDRDDADSSEGN